MADVFTKLSDYKDWGNTVSGFVLNPLKSVSNKGITNGDLKINYIVDHCEEINNEYEVMKMTNSEGKILSIRACHASNNDWLNYTSDAFLILFAYNGSDIVMMHYHPFDNNLSTSCVKLYLIDGDQESLIDTLEYSTYRDNTIGLNIQLRSEFWTQGAENDVDLEIYSGRMFAQNYDTLDLDQSGLLSLIHSYNANSYLRANDLLDLFISGTDDIESKTPASVYYYDSRTFKTDFDRSSKTQISHNYGRVGLTNGGRIFFLLNDNKPYNMDLHVIADKFRGAFNTTEYSTYTEVPDINITYKTLINDGFDYYYGITRTNIPIFGSLGDADYYVLTGDSSRALNGDDILDNDDKSEKVDETGTKVDRIETNDYNIANTFQRTYIINEVYDSLATWLYNPTTQSIFSDVVLWGNNPIDVIIDYYWTPIDVLTMGIGRRGLAIKMGGIFAGDDGTGESEHIYGVALTDLCTDEYTICEESITPVYNDWRDYALFSYHLYLPFYGMIDFQPYHLINKTLKITAKYFINTHILKYYVRASGYIIGEYEILVGATLPLTAADQIGKAQDNLQGTISIVNGAGSIIGGEVGITGSLASGDVGGVLNGASSIGNGVTGIINGIIQKEKAATLKAWGSVSVSGNIFDTTYPYLIIEEQGHIKPSNLNDVYNYPSYYIGKISTCNGYCEISDVRLSGMGSYSDQEKEQLKAILRGGVIL